MNDTYYGSALIVDDEPMVLDSLGLLLKRFGFHVIPCASGVQAIDEFARQTVDVVLSDIRMSGMSGLELLDKLKEMNPEVPVILITAYAELDVAIESVKKGAFDFIVKPYRPEQISHSVEKAIRFYRLLQVEKDYRDRLEELNRDMETLVAERTMSMMAFTIADKIRNPSVVLGMTCRRLAAEELPEKLKSTVTSICQEAEKLENIVGDFEELLKNRKSMFGYEDINAIIKDIEPVFAREAGVKKVRFSLKLSSEPLRINAQKNLLKAAILHLLRNSLDATSEGGLIAVETEKTDESADLTITDTGKGIAKEYLERIFDPFFSTKERRFGIGLSLARQIISEHMGVIKVESEVGKGTTFRIVLPARWVQKGSKWHWW
jgi:two-component system NtrC family sensor kinase